MTLLAPQPATATVVARPRRRRRTPAADALLVLLGGNLGLVLAIGLARFGADTHGPGGLATWFGRLTGLLAEVLVLGQILLASRVPWLERAAGQDTLLRWHRRLAPVSLAALVAHPLLLVTAYTAQQPGAHWWGQLWTLSGSNLTAVLGVLLFVVAGFLSIRVLRRWMPYEGWYAVHLTTYAAVLLAWGHQLSLGSGVLHGQAVRFWWTAQLVTVLAAAGLYRIGLPLLRALRHRVRVEAVVREAEDVVSVHLRGHAIDRLRARGGQFIVWRFLTPDGWWRSHPFSLSSAPRDGRLRLTAREIGDGSRALADLQPGTWVVPEGPYGVLTDAVRTRPYVLLIGAGLGVAPIRALLEDIPGWVDTVVLHRASSEDTAVLHDELVELGERRDNTRVHLITGRRGKPDDPTRPLGPLQMHRLVPDVGHRDVYVCGPPGLTDDLLVSLRYLGVPDAQVHVESFEL